ncbi:hypothetical protein BTO30_14850 [Domibacillus antri]|uniref:Uncharacterized protein n=1 Tax=Domibacillus antri TaxID=1714264 RepID=A0A1Q8Q227_9BACI|nr:hypothetical protein [Domibacillus antri]OLN21396.1 hypothetical protein BTO30_14850 [Domibacillus antri]
MKDIIRVGTVSSISGSTARITYDDRENAVSSELPIVQRGDVFQLMVGDQVLVVYLPNSKGEGFIIGKV